MSRAKRVRLHKPSGHGKGKWQNMNTLERYIAKRNRMNKLAKEARKRNR